MARIHQIHDKFVKRSLQEKRIAMAFLQAHLPAAIYQILNMETLTLTNKSLVPPGLREIHCDIVYQCQIDRDDGFIIFLIEHQSSTPELMAFRKLQYTVGLMDQYLRAGHTKLPLVLSICIYHGKKSPYPSSTDVYDEFEHPELARQLVFKPFILIDLTTLSEEEIEKHGLVALMEMLLKHSRAKDFIGQLKRFFYSAIFSNTIELLGREYFNDVLTYIFYSNVNQRPRSSDAVIQALKETLPNEEEVIMTLAEELEQIGKQKGRQEGMQKGMRKGMKKGRREGEYQKALSIAKKMLEAGVEFAFIKQVTELSDEEITALIQKH